MASSRLDPHSISLFAYLSGSGSGYDSGSDSDLGTESDLALAFYCRPNVEAGSAFDAAADLGYDFDFGI